MKISTCLSTSPARFDAVPFTGDFEHNAARIADLGFDGIELAVRDPGIIDQEQILAAVAAAGMEIPAIGTGQAWGEERLSFTSGNAGTREKAVERIVSHMPFARKAGAVIIIGLVRGVPDKDTPQSSIEGWMLDAFRFGAPPHGGIALGLDRIAMLLTGAKSLRDVIAFPKNQRAVSLMDNSPDVIDNSQLEELHIRLAPGVGKS